MHQTAIVILAAGSSSRMGSVKQLLPFKTKTLLGRVCDEAFASGASPVVVVTGANAAIITKTLDQQRLQVVFNQHWQQGMASGIALGVSEAGRLKNDTGRIILTVCDQPFISASLFIELYKKSLQNTKGIIASAYAGTIGTPVLFDQKYFEALKGLGGDEGAKKLLRVNAHDVDSIDFPGGEIDIDTQQDYTHVISS